MEVNETATNNFQCEIDAETADIIASLAAYHKIPASDAMELVFKKGLYRYKQRTLREIEGAPINQ